MFLRPGKATSAAGTGPVSAPAARSAPWYPDERAGSPLRCGARARVGVMVVALVLLLALAVACGSDASEQATATQGLATAGAGQEVETEGGAYIDVTPGEFRAMLDRKDFFMVNVHIPYEGEIAQTDLFIPYDGIQGRLADLPAKDAKIVLYCRSGRMSAIAASTLVGLGYTNVWNLAGGMVAWEQAGQPVLDSQP